MNRYAALMEELKLRMDLITRLLSGKDKLPISPTYEMIALQFRKMLELIAFGSLIANKKAYEAVHRRFAEEWNANRLLKQLENVNPSFYPVPVVQVKGDVPGIQFRHNNLLQDILQKVHSFLSTKSAVSLFTRRIPTAAR
jgi:hypothetical protein